MAKKKDKKKRSQKQPSAATPTSDNDSDNDTVSSDASSQNSSAATPNDDSDSPAWQDSLLEALDFMSDKREHMRLKALRTIHDTMCGHFVNHVLDRYAVSLVDAALNCVNKGSHNEATLAAHLLSVIAFSIGDINTRLVSDALAQSIIQQLEDALQKGNKVAPQLALQQQEQQGDDSQDSDSQHDSKSDNSEDDDDNGTTYSTTIVSKSQRQTQRLTKTSPTSIHRSAVISALCIWRFVREPATDMLLPKKGSLDSLPALYWSNTDDGAFLASSIRAWSLMLSKIDMHARYNVVFSKAQPLLMALVENSGHSNVRLAAGEALCLLYEAYHKLHDHTDNDDQDHTKDNDAADENNHHEQHYKDAVQLFQHLSAEASKSTAKKQKAKQKFVFRQYLKTIEHGEAPEEHITVKKTRIDFVGWSALVQYHTLKQVLGHGITRHVEHNALVRHLFDLDSVTFNDKDVKKLSSRDKKVFMSKNSEHSKMDTLDKAKRTRHAINFAVGEEW